MSVPGTLPDLSERILTAVRGAKTPLTFKKLQALVKGTKQTEAVRHALESVIDTGQVYRWPPKHFWHISSDVSAGEAVLAAAAIRALPKKELSAAAAKKLPGFSAERVENVIAALLAGKKLTALPAFTGNARLLIQPGDNKAYFTSARIFMEQKLRKAGFDPAEFFTRNSPSRATLSVEPARSAALILEAVSRLEPVKGVPVPASRLRNTLPNLTKAEFDAGSLELRKKQEVFLSLHADPNNIPPTEKNLLIDGQDGNYYVAISLR